MTISRNTRQKELIIEEIEKFNRFFNSEELFERVKNKDGKIGIATVYRVLKDLKGKHRLHSYVCDRKTIYSKDSRSHCHFRCEKCGEVSHVNVEKLDFLKKNFPGDICHVQIDVTGICPNCS
ncbi:MAG: transcriptional repressor [Candidatus Pacearchaeota archaeon]|jgi:Fur family ferric uptake transcriptional regulator|nr:transcriptional repressor [Candidatus Pacearchaeota archaeon]HJO14566.1 transcriptional repressor [Candidatus Pacearchaeota archaeon]|tara:strand:+ start:52 stop:417 length:366 start_codon:yes stop_codon:yes gene_type:complete